MSAPLLAAIRRGRRRALAVAVATGRDMYDWQRSANVGAVAGMPADWPTVAYVTRIESTAQGRAALLQSVSELALEAAR
jgi:hypothetical protein